MPIYYVYPAAYEGGTFSGSAGSVDKVDDTYGAWDLDEGYISASFAQVDKPKEARFTTTPFLPFATSINAVKVGVYCREAGSPTEAGIEATTVLKVGTTTYYGTPATLGDNAYTVVETNYTTNPSTAVAWQVAEMAQLVIGVWGQDTDTPLRTMRCTGIWAAIDYDGLSALTEQARDAASRRQWGLRKAKAFLSLTVPLHVGLEVELMDPFWVEHLAGAHVTDEGWRAKLWQLRAFRVYERTVDAMAGTVTLLLRDRRSHMCLYRDTKSARSSSPLAPGLGRFGAGVARTYTRAGDAWVLDPGSKLFVRRLDNEPLYMDGGTEFGWEAYIAAETNYLSQSAFKNYSAPNFTGWTRNGTGSGADVTEATDYLLWDVANTGVARAALFTAPIPLGGSDLELVSTATASFAANADVWVLVWHEEIVGVAYLRLQRGVDSRYWRESDNSWQVAETWNPLPSITSIDDIWDHYASKNIDVGASGTTLTASLGVPTTGTPGTSFAAYHVKLTDAADPTPIPILTEATAVTTARTADSLSNEAAKRCISETRGAIACEVRPFWASADIGSTNRTLAYWSNEGGAPYCWVYYDGTNDRWAFEASDGTTTNRAVLAGSVTRGTIYRVVARWTGSNAELDLPAYTLSILVDGVKGTDASIPAGARDQIPTAVEVGARNGSENLSGLMRLLTSVQYVPTDAEAARLT